jgi:hypothetical protein
VASNASAAIELLRLVEVVIHEILYIDQFAREKLFFRRVRIPPLLHVYWDSIFINHAVRKLLLHFVRDPEEAIRSGEAAFALFGRIAALARQIGLPEDDVYFMRDTFALILLARRFYLMPPEPALCEEIRSAKKAYKARWPRSQRQRYRIRLDLETDRFNRRTMNWLLGLLVRRHRGYRRMLDRLFTLNILSWIYFLLRSRHQKALPKFLRKTAMGVDSLFR